MSDSLELSKFSLTRMSHDLAGMMTALSASLELLDEAGGADAESLSLAQAAAQGLIARLTFFRAAFGAKGPLTSVRAAKETAETYLKSLENKPIAYRLDFKLPAQAPMFVLRLSLLGVQICADCLARGGDIRIEVNEARRTFEITGSGERVAVDPAIADLLNAKPASLSSPKQVAAAYFIETAQANKWRVSLEQGSGYIKIVCGE